MQTIFIADRLDFWTLQFYRRLSCRSPNVKVISFDPIWEQYINWPEDLILLPKIKLKKFPVTLSQSVLKKTEYSFDLVKSKHCDLKIVPNSNYLTSITYTSKFPGTAILSANFYGSEGQRDFEQKHINLVHGANSHIFETELPTGNFDEKESIYLRLWTSLSDTKTNIQIHSVTISREGEIRNQIKKLISKNTYCFWRENDTFSMWLKSLPIKNLSEIDLYKCEIEPRKFGSKIFCIREHKNKTKTELCEIVKASHQKTTENVIFINNNSIVSKRMSINISFETEKRNLTYCLLSPTDLNFNPDKKTIVVEKENLNPTEYSSVIFTKKLNRDVLLKCWASGTATFCTQELPPDLENGPIKKITLNQIKDIKKYEYNLKELGYIAAKTRIHNQIKMDIESLIHFNQFKT